MKYLYTEQGLKELDKSKKLHIFLMCLFIALTLISLIVFISVATYQTRNLFSIICSVVVTILSIVSIFFVSKFIFIKKICYIYSYLLHSTDTVIECKVLKCSDFLTTLPDRSRCYEVLVLKDDREMIYYLSDLFDIKDIREGEIKLTVHLDYIKGYEYED